MIAVRQRMVVMVVLNKIVEISSSFPTTKATITTTTTTTVNIKTKGTTFISSSFPKDCYCYFYCLDSYLYPLHHFPNCHYLYHITFHITDITTLYHIIDNKPWLHYKLFMIALIYLFFVMIHCCVTNSRENLGIEFGWILEIMLVLLLGNTVESYYHRSLF